MDYRLLVVSSRARNKVAIFNSVLSHNLILVDYNYESTTLDDLLEKIKRALNGTKVASMALVLHTSERELFICSPGSALISLKTLINDDGIKRFCVEIAQNVIDQSNWGARLDFLATYAAVNLDGAMIAKEITSLMGIPVGLSSDLFGNESQIKTGTSGKTVPIGDLYFDISKLKIHLQNVGKVAKEGAKKLKNYEKIRIVGKGAFGNAVLYRRKDDGLMCIIKEINMLDLNANDRQMSLNEVKVLSKMDHPNIVAYHDSFEKDGILMIEMEYADGGNLAEFLAKRTVRMDERDILDIMYQMVSAIRYMHAHHVLHRDLKTANIFLTKEGTVKIGDFGISKVLTTRASGAHTVLGTPYYISPEMCEGKAYDEKSDIWALGCIFYEMACLQKTFEGSNLPALVNKIMRGQFAPIRGQYSPQLKQLVRDLLQKDPAYRPTATTVLLERMPELMAQFANGHAYDIDDPEIDEDGLEVLSESRETRVKTSRRPLRSVLYYMKGYESSISLTPVQLPARSKILQVAVSTSHIVALTSELLVFTWGDGRRGQLGHGELETWRSRPEAVESLKTKSITKVGAGDGFSVFASDNGIVMTCGDGTLGCLGHGDWQSLAIPKLVEALLSIDVSAVSCGPEHVVVVGGQGDVYTWGRGCKGRLGLGHEEDCCTPQEIKGLNTEDIYIVNVACSGSGTLLLSDAGTLYACGENNENRLGLDTPGLLGLSHNSVEYVLVPTRIKSIKSRIMEIAMGPNHTVLLTDQGKVITMGQNSDAQLGRGHSRSYSRSWPEIVKTMGDKEVTLIAAGASFTVVGTNENVVYFWGTRYVSPYTRPSTREVFSQSFGSRMATPSDAPLSESDVHTMMHLESMRKEMSSGFHQQLVLDTNQMEEYEKTLATLSSSALLKHQSDITLKDVVTDPQEILALFASQKQQEKGEIVMLKDIKSMNQNIFLTVDTTCPLARCETPSTPKTPSGFEPPPTIVEDEVRIENESKSIEKHHRDRDHHKSRHRHSRKRSHRRHHHRSKHHMDQSEIPDWIKAEMADAEEIKGRKADNSDQQKTSQRKSLADENDTLKRKMQKELEQKRKEYLLEAENVVRIREEAFNQELLKLQTELDHQKRIQADQLKKMSDGSGYSDNNGSGVGGSNKKEAISEKCVIQ